MAKLNLWFLDNYAFPYVGASNGFHVHINSQVKHFFSFKGRYSMKNLGLICYNKCFLYASVVAHVSSHDAILLKESSIYSGIVNKNVILDRVIQLHNFGEIPLLTIGNSAFP